MDFVHRIRQVIKDEKLLIENDTVVAAVSGGPDSTALLHVLHQLRTEWNLELIVAHVNHQFRGRESEQEAQFVKRLADKLGLPCEIGEIDLPSYIQEQGINAQVASREKRYEFLHQVANRYGADKIALAHHADDQAETVLMRIIRGTAPSGLKGMSMRRSEQGRELIRPFLRSYKSEIINFCNQHEIDYCLDSSNDESIYTRNQVRLDLIPYIQKWNEQLPEALNRLATLMEDEDRFIEDEARKVFKRLINQTDKHYFFSKKEMLSLPLALQRRLIKLILSYLSPQADRYDFNKVEMIREALLQTTTPSMTLDLSERHSFMMEYDRVQIGQRTEPLSASHSDYEYTIGHHEALPTQFKIRDRTIRAEIKAANNSEASAHLNHVLFDLDGIKFPLLIRNRRAGDRMRILGLDGSQKVKDIFINEKVAPSLRESIPIVVDGEGRLLWIAGIRRSSLAKINEQTQHVLCISYD